ncbi:RNA ligase family protein [Polyangium fumosum]|uniref:RNA ligase n=1 Tax=Polyangium fumosum TaxID=889272 RepID=A0A4U1J075_9BACT|nr:RNA ligase family protein [Polyangium fumosum]TKD00278.1 RNA ligase [Polyangium fumosum]
MTPPPIPPFSPYEKIAESLAAALGDDEAAHRAASRAEWIVTEKIHGANFCFVTEGEEVRCAKRKGLLADDEDFFGHRGVLRRCAGGVRDVLARVKTRAPKATSVFVYGELFGGGYPHPDVPPVPGVQPVQTGCWYAPGIEFCAFDVGFVQEGGPERVYLDQDEAREACEEAGIPFARPLFRGRYEDAFAYPLGFETTIPARLGLPSLGPSNKAEGVVLKPARALVVPRRAGVVRPVVKRKIAEFAEDERFHEAEKWSGPRAPAASALDWLVHEASSLVNENRLNAAVSKVGPTRPGDTARLGEVLALVREDLDVELHARHADALRALSPADSRALAAHLDSEARALVELYLGAAPP